MIIIGGWNVRNTQGGVLLRYVKLLPETKFQLLAGKLFRRLSGVAEKTLQRRDIFRSN
jgi:hypothetical protein